MNQVTNAYQANDLYWLLTIETKWVLKNNENLSKLTEEKIEVFNQVLREQEQTLKQELWNVVAHPRFAQLNRFNAISDTAIRFEINREEKRLNQVITNTTNCLEELRSTAPLKELKLLIKEKKQMADRWEPPDLW